MGQAAVSKRPPNWQLLEAIPDYCRDGRDVLLWNGHPLIATYCDGWRDPVGRLVNGATHFADADGPVS